jgi:hypothetical protein
MDFKTFIALEIEEIQKHKWIESERAGRDLTGIAEEDWIEKYEKNFIRYIETMYGPIRPDFESFVAMEIEEIKKFKWIESERAKRDLTGIAEADWIKKYAEKFRDQIERKYGPINQEKRKFAEDQFIRVNSPAKDSTMFTENLFAENYS